MVHIWAHDPEWIKKMNILEINSIFKKLRLHMISSYPGWKLVLISSLNVPYSGRSSCEIQTDKQSTQTVKYNIQCSLYFYSAFLMLLLYKKGDTRNMENKPIYIVLNYGCPLHARIYGNCMFNCAGDFCNQHIRMPFDWSIALWSHSDSLVR